MEQLYPQNIIERRYPVLREQREKAEREALEKPEKKEETVSLESDSEPSLYEPIPYNEGSVGQYLNTLA